MARVAICIINVVMLGKQPSNLWSPTPQDVFLYW